MCLLTNQTKPIITTEDIIVYKVVKNLIEDIIVSTYQRFPYKKNELNKTKFTYGNPDARAPFDDVDFASWRGESPEKVIEKGFHFAFTIKRLEKIVEHYYMPERIIAEFLVPKGSKIYKGKEDLGVSNQIIYTGNIIKQKKLKNKKQI